MFVSSNKIKTSFCKTKPKMEHQQVIILLALVVASSSLLLVAANQHPNDASHFNETSPRSAQDQQQQARPTTTRTGRMLDLDQLAGDIGKEEKVARERQQSGDRQSRQLGGDGADLFQAMTDQQKRGQRSGGGQKKGKKMSISGFIPIVSLIDHKHEDSETQDGGEQEESQQQQQQQVSNLLSSYGGQTSLGHASFGPHQPVNEQPTQAELADRASRKLLSHNPSNLLGHLANHHHHQKYPSALASQLIPQRITQAPQFAQPSADQCICVPFYQCKHGYLSESQLSKTQFAGFAQPQPALLSGHQNPRALSGHPLDPALYSAGQQQLISSVGNGQQQQQQPPVFNQDELIYEQLKKTIESENLEQQAAFGGNLAAGPLLDERSNQKGNSSTTETDLVARNILNPLGAFTRQQQPLIQKPACGIMRTCCRVPPHLAQQQQHQQLYQSPSNQRQTRQPQQLQLLQPMRQPRPQQQLNQFRPPPYQEQQQPQLTTLVGPPVQQPPPPPPPPTSNHQQQSGGFMAGRCGLRPALGISGRVQNSQPAPGSESSAEFGEFPAHAAILRRLNNNQNSNGGGDSLFVCSAALISGQWLATAAHCVRRLQPEELKVRLGEWDVNRDDEFYPFVEAGVRDIIVHPDFQPSSLINDLALIRLDQPVDAQQMPHIAPACLAEPQELFQGQRCWLAGWGKDAFGAAGSFQSVLRKVDLPVVGRQECETALRYHTKLGKFFRLHQSAMCAGGERGKDACEGDGGSGLYCQDPSTGLTKLAGLVSWGVGCGQVGVPGVYTNLAPFYHWLEQMVATSGEESLYMDRNASNDGQNNFKSIISERNMQRPHQNGTSSRPEVAKPPSSGMIEVAPPATTATNATETNASAANEEADLESRAG